MNRYRIEAPGMDWRGKYGWGLAWRYFKENSLVETECPNDAIKRFNEITAGKKQAYRLVKYDGFGFCTTKRVIYRNEHQAEPKPILNRVTGYPRTAFPCDNEP